MGRGDLGQFLRMPGVQVVAVRRGAKEDLAPSGDAVIREGDLLVVEGKQADLKESSPHVRKKRRRRRDSDGDTTI